MKELNCPNCGAPITDVTCPYCGTVFYDFASIRDDKPTYIRIKFNDDYMVFRARMNVATINISSYDALPDVDINFTVFPDDKGVYLEQRKVSRYER